MTPKAKAMIDGEIIMLVRHMADNLKNNGTASPGAGHGFLGKALRGEAESVGDNVMFESFININRAPLSPFPRFLIWHRMLVTSHGQVKLFVMLC